MSRIEITQRPRRNRTSAGLRNLMRETDLRASNLLLPLFVTEGKGQKVPINAMPGQFRLSLDELVKVCQEAVDLGVSGVALFPVLPESKKDVYAKESKNPDGLLQRAIGELKSKFPQLVLIGDVAMDPYSTDGHDGLVRNGEIVNDETLPILGEMAVAQARAGVDLVGPSDMMDGRVGFIRRALDEAGFEKTGIISYAAKYASAFYGPFREALDSAPRAGDKKTYQMDFANRREALREALLDVEEGADILMIKPALSYLDVISAIRERTNVPIAAYQVSGEYAMIKAAAERGWIDEEKAMLEATMSIKRAGADMILTYFALQLAKVLAR